MMRWLVIASLLALAACATIPTNSPRPLSAAGVGFSTDGEIASFATGIADPATGRLLTPDDPARVASVSKMTVAIGVMRLVEAGKLDLDRDVSGYLGFELRNPAFPAQPITLRLLLSHTSSVRDHDDQYAIPLGRTLGEVMADPHSWDLRHGPGSGYFTYSNLNFPIVASVIERVTGERFDLWIQRAVLDPMKLDACFNWVACSDAQLARAVVLTREGKPVKDDLKGMRPPCPVYLNDGDACDLGRWRPGENGAMFSPQGGLRISVRGLSRIGRMLLGRGTLDGVRILAPASVETLLSQLWRYDGRNGDAQKFYCSYGLASQALIPSARGCAGYPSTPGYALVGHAGEAYGLRSGLWIDRERGLGVAYFLTDQPDSTPRDASMTASEAAIFLRAMALLPR